VYGIAIQNMHKEELNLDFSMFDNIRFEPEMRKHEPNDMPNMMSRPRFPEHTPLAMAYVPLQQWGQTYDEEKAFERGTIFPELDLPLAPEEGCL
jgi:hypothetical protein